MKPIRILLADDHNIVLEGLHEVLSSHPEIAICGKASNGTEVLSFVQQTVVDVVVLDINMPVMDGLTCARKLKQLHPTIKVIILTMYAQKSFTEQIIKIGVDGCLLKSNTSSELMAAINRVMEGKFYYDQIKTFKHEMEEVAQYKLSEREIEIIKLLAQGLTSLQIADKIFIAEHTVKTHRKNILRKTGLHNTTQLINFALTNQII
jgi:DNA-binding NarL/FixJ family response regulator